MDALFIRYRKVILVASIYMFLYCLYDIYNGVNSINLEYKGTGIGTLLNACVSLFLSIYFFVKFRKAHKKFKEENAVELVINKDKEG